MIRHWQRRHGGLAFRFRCDMQKSHGRIRMAPSRSGVVAAAAVLTATFASQPASRAAPTLDYGFFKVRVEPIFL
jgi:hypothetical protein